MALDISDFLDDDVPKVSIPKPSLKPPQPSIASKISSAMGGKEKELQKELDVVTKDLTETMERLEAAEVLLEEQKEMKEQLDALLSRQRQRNKMRQLRLANKHSLRSKMQYGLNVNIAKEMRTAKAGMVMEKIDQKRSQRQRRLVVLDDEQLLLRWGPPPGPLAYNCTCLQLPHLLRIEWGRGSRSWSIFQEAPMNLCFSLYTVDRSFDFICPDEKAVRSFVLSISRVCPSAVGSVRCRRQFLARSGWLKVEDRCLRECISLPQALYSAIRRAAIRLGLIERRTKIVSHEHIDKANPFTFVKGADVDTDDDELDEPDNPFTFVAPNPFTFIAQSSQGSLGTPRTPRLSRRRGSIVKKSKFRR